MGVGRSSFLESYQGYNIDYGESRQRFTESLDVLLGAWCNDTFSYQGEFYNFKNVRLVPKTYQIPHPPVRVAVESRDTFTLAGTLGFPIFIRHQMSVSELQQLLSEYKDARATLRVQLRKRSTILKKVQCIGSVSFRIISIRQQMRRHTNG